MLTGQHVALDDMLTGRENLVMFGRLQGLKKVAARSRAKELLDQFDLVDAADRRVSTYSGGMRRRIDIACGLVVRPEVVFLDEPTTGLDPRSRQSIWELVSDFKEAGIATLLTTQYLEEADALSDRIIVIDHGTIIAEGTADELKERTGATYCEIVPRHLKDLPAMAGALGSLLPEKNRAALTPASDRIAMPAADGPKTLLQALYQLNAANIELARHRAAAALARRGVLRADKPGRQRRVGGAGRIRRNPDTRRGGRRCRTTATSPRRTLTRNRSRDRSQPPRVCGRLSGRRHPPFSSGGC